VDLVSVEAISWALNNAPVPADRNDLSRACKFVLVGLANHAGPDESGAFPSAAALVRYTSLSERTVRTCLDRLEAAGIITPCDPDIVAARIKRADRCPQGWDLDLSLVRDDLTAESPGEPDRSGANSTPSSVPHRSGQDARPSLGITSSTTCNCCTLSLLPGATSARTGCNRCSHGVQRLHQNRP
jgi:Helix-turn-helix domain